MPEMPRYGVRFRLPERMDAFAYFGRGPEENYWDRKTGAAVGRYRSTVAEQYHDYSRPQETGNKADVRWFTLTNADGNGVKFTADGVVQFSALPVLQSDLDHVRSNDDRRHGGLVDFRDIVSVNIDHVMMGVGGDNSWGYLPMDKYLVKAKPYSWRFTMQPVSRTGN